MTEDDKYMDDLFKKAGKEIKFPYQSSFWDDVEIQLADESLDSAFKSAADKVLFVPQMDLSESIDDAFLDESFKTASSGLASDYSSAYWKQFQAELPLIQQDEAFLHASNSTVAPYQPHYWSDADVALQNEGLHYEYKSAYWNEAKALLDKSDRGIFFFKWSAVAVILLLFSFAGIYQANQTNEIANVSPSLNFQESILNTIDPAVVLQKKVISDSNSENDLTNSSDLIALENNDENENFAVNNIVKRSTVNNGQTVDATVKSHINPMLSMNADPVLSETINSRFTDRMEFSHDQNNALTTETSNSILNNSSFSLNNLNQTQVENTDAGLINKLAIQDVSTIDNRNEMVYIQPEIEIIRRSNLPSTHTISFLGQAGLGNKYGTIEFTPSWRTSFGFEYLNTSFGRLRNFELGGSLSLNHARQNDFGTERRVSVFQNDGGVEKFWYKLQIKDMLYANLSATCNYRINHRHKLKLSLGVDYLVFVQSNMSYQNKADEGITTVNNNWGVKDGLNKFDVRLGTGYELQITNRLALQANASYGFLDRTDDDFLKTKISDHEMNITFGIKYTLFRKL